MVDVFCEHRDVGTPHIEPNRRQVSELTSPSDDTVLYLAWKLRSFCKSGLTGAGACVLSCMEPSVVRGGGGVPAPPEVGRGPLGSDGP